MLCQPFYSWLIVDIFRTQTSGCSGALIGLVYDKYCNFLFVMASQRVHVSLTPVVSEVVSENKFVCAEAQ